MLSLPKGTVSASICSVFKQVNTRNRQHLTATTPSKPPPTFLCCVQSVRALSHLELPNTLWSLPYRFSFHWEDAISFPSEMQIALYNKHLFLIATDFFAVKIYDRPKYSNNKPQTVIRTQSLISLYCYLLPFPLS